MDRYLFRGKRIDNGEWVQGSLRQGKHVKPAIIDECFIFEIDPSTIGQCTGLKDKNGNLIFESDIVKINADDTNNTDDNVEFIIAKVAYAYNKYVLKDIEGEAVNECFYHTFTGFDKTEIIGNIHENSDLIV